MRLTSAQKLQNYFLIGPMGSGKTAVGQQLANILHRTFYDSDQEVERRCNMSITELFANEGEAAFRQYEQQLITELAAMSGIVLATGGGAVLNANVRSLLAKQGKVIYLQTSVDQQLQRIAGSISRPLLHTANPRQTLIELTDQRELFYREVADWCIVTDGLTVSEVVAAILRKITR